MGQRQVDSRVMRTLGGATLRFENTLEAGRILRERCRRPNRAPHEFTTAVRAAHAQFQRRAAGAECAFEAAYPSIAGVGREIAIAALAVRLQDEHSRSPTQKGDFDCSPIAAVDRRSKRRAHLDWRRRRSQALKPDLRRALATAPFALRSARFAQRNSLADMAMPTATMGKPGPGNTSNAMPTKSTVPPARATMIFFNQLPGGSATKRGWPNWLAKSQPDKYDSCRILSILG